MPRPSKGARLYFRARAGREGVFVILDGSTEVSTGFGREHRHDAEKALGEYIGRKHRPEWRSGDPAEVAVADVLAFYAREKAPSFAHPELVGFHMQRLLEYFGERLCSDVSGEVCRGYVAARVAGKIGPRPVKPGTARRELETLGAALGFAYGEKKLAYPVPVTYPAKAPRRERWLTRSEAARLLAGALGFAPVAYDVVSREPVKFGRVAKPSYHVARFILIALYTGTRHEAVLRLRWGVNSEGGWFDLDNRMLYRRGQGEAETNKRRTPAPIPTRLLPHVRRWRKITANGPVEYAGMLIAKERTGFKRARTLAGLGGDVTPHVLKHTCATWMLQRGVSIWTVAGYLGTSEKVIRDTYGHHSPDHLADARDAFLGRNLGRSK